VLQHVYVNFPNGLIPDTKSVKRVLEAFAEKTSDDKWRLKPQVKQRESEHNLIVEKLAEIGKQLGFMVHADLQSWRSTIDLSLPQKNISRIKEIDVVWYNKDEITHEFEVENTTGIIDGIARGSNIPGSRAKRYIVIPEERQNFFYQRIAEPMLKQKVLEYGWQFIFYDALTTFYEQNKRRKSVDIREFERLGRTPRWGLEKQQSIGDFL
jgi:hypothetical protein